MALVAHNADPNGPAARRGGWRNRHGRGWSRRQLLAAGASFAAFVVFGSTARADGPVNVLCVAYSGPFGLDPNVRNLENNLRAAPGVNVTAIIGPSAGDLADLLSQGSYDQVYIWDLDLFPPAVNQADKSALKTWWDSAAGHRNIVLDSRSGALFRDNDADEQLLTKNVVANFSNRGGGLWIGARYAPEAAQTANAYLAGLSSGAELFDGGFDDVGPVTGVANPLLTTPNTVNAAGLAYSYLGQFSRSIAPETAPDIGPLIAVATDSAQRPLITTNIPEPTGFLGLGVGAALFASRRRR